MFLNIICPMMGLGSRFARQGIVTPKPLIKLKDRYLFDRALSFLSDMNDVKYKLFFTVRAEHVNKYKIDDKIKQLYPYANIIVLEQDTKGPVDTIYQSLKFLEPGALLSVDCDLEFKSKNFCNFLTNCCNKNILQHALLSFKSNDKRYSYAAVDNNFNVLKTQEKIVISDNALCGAYFFSSIDKFIQAKNLMETDRNYQLNEFYTSMLFNYLIAQGDIVKLFHVDSYKSYGTPEELQQCL